MSSATTIRVFCEDTDFQGVVYHPTYFKFMERSRTEWLRKYNMQQSTIVQELGVYFQTIGFTDVVFKRPAQMDDELVVMCYPKDMGKASFTVRHEILRGGDLIASAEVKLACVSAASGRLTAVPARFLEAWQQSLAEMEACV